jgi:hypothetical protein
MIEKIVGSGIMVVVGGCLLFQCFRGKEFHLVGIGGASRKQIPHRVGRPLSFIFGLAAIAGAIVPWIKN